MPEVSGLSGTERVLTCTSSGGPATYVTWRRNCVALPNNDTYLQSQMVMQTQTATYQNTLTISADVAEPDGVYTCSVSNARGYGNSVVGLGGMQ